MVRILGIVGSPRKGGNTEILTEHLLKGAEEMEAETELVSLSDINLNYCR
ncbi:MAG: NAD(P)H-dependent oxidoreductase, partial [Nitrospirae bacterium]|nr:NAD(P)H-dependent oxidoreductase [Nitrospirota bacterium]